MCSYKCHDPIITLICFLHLAVYFILLTDANVLFLSTTAHDLGLLIGLKNSAELASNMQPKFDFAIVEECNEYKECDRYKDFVKNDKPVFAVEYRKKKKKLCKKFKNMKYSLIFGNYSLKKFEFC